MKTDDNASVKSVITKILYCGDNIHEQRKENEQENSQATLRKAVRAEISSKSKREEIKSTQRKLVNG